MKHYFTFFKLVALLIVLIGVYETGEAGFLIYGALVYAVYRVLFGNTTCAFLDDTYS